MKKLNMAEASAVRGGAYLGSHATCYTCGKSVKLGWTLGTTFRRLFWSKSDFSYYLGSLHYNAIGNYIKNPH